MRKGPFVNVERLSSLLAEEVENNNYIIIIGQNTPIVSGGIQRIADKTGLGERAISSIVNKRTAQVSFPTLDAILTGLELLHLSYTSEEEGGFQDVYDAPAPTGPRRKKDPRKRNGRQKDNCACGRIKQARSQRCVGCVKENAVVYKCISCDVVLRGKRFSEMCRSCYDKSPLARVKTSSRDWHRKKTEMTTTKDAWLKKEGLTTRNAT
jgi:hypothetical protein